MKLKWTIHKRDIMAVVTVCEKHQANNIFQKRLDINCSNRNFKLTKDKVWKSIFLCLLSTQQKSDDNSATSRFLKHGFYPLHIKKLRTIKNLEEYILKELKLFGGIRRNERIAHEAVTIFNYLEDTDWLLISKLKLIIRSKGDSNTERIVANEIVLNKSLKGLGPKQSRNFIQYLGLSQYEIPIDSRIFSWLNMHKIFPFEVTSKGLADSNYYDFLSDAIIILCSAAGVKPCLFDAAVFAEQSKQKVRD